MRQAPDKIWHQEYFKKDWACSGGKQSASAQVSADVGHGSVEDGNADRAGAGAAGPCQN